MPTIEELFRSKPIGSGGETAEKLYDIRDSKKVVRITAANSFDGLLINNTGFALARLARRGLSSRLSESLLEEEVTGLRIIRGGSVPVLYGSELPRIILRTTPLLDTMKGAANGELSSGGAIGGKITKARDAISKTLGIPQTIIPTKVSSDSRLIGEGKTQDRMIHLAEIRKSGEGSLLGKFLKEGGGGSLQTIGKQAIGGAINLAKDKIRGKLFGERSTTGFNPADPNKNGSNTSFNYGSISNPVGVVIKTDPATGTTDVGGLRYSKTFNFNITDKEPGRVNFLDTAELEGGIAKKTPNVVIRKFTVPAFFGFSAQEVEIPLYSQLFNTLPRKTSEDTISKDGKIIPQDKLVFPKVKELKDEGEGNSVLLGENGLEKHENKIELTLDRTRFSSDPDRQAKFLPTLRGMIEKSDNTSYSDTINKLGVVSTDATSTDAQDFAPLFFWSIQQGKGVQFRATISGLSETFSPSWDSNKFIGNPFNYYTYTGIERSVQFNFKTFALEVTEQKTMWDKINFLSSLVYPQGYYSNSSVAPPFIRFTLGDMYKSKNSFIESLSYTIDDNTPWQISDKESDRSGTDHDMKGYRLPMIVDVAITIKFLESRGNTEGKKFYTFTPQTT
jgi:hypothetical protein